MDHLGVIIIALAVIALVSCLVAFKVRRDSYARLAALRRAGDWDAFYRHLDSVVMRAVMPVLARENLRFDAMAEQGRSDELVAQFNRIMHLKLTPSQNGDVLVRGYNAFAHEGDSKHTLRIVQQMKAAARAGSFREAAYEAYQQHWDVVFGHDGSHTRWLKGHAAGLPAGKARGYYEYLAACSYANLGDEESSSACLAEAARDYGCGEKDLTRRVNVVTAI